MEPLQRLADLETRLETLEKMLGIATAKVGISESDSSPTSLDGHPSPVVTTLPPNVASGSPTRRVEELSLLGSGGIVCLVLAAIYLVKLAVDSGWLTPVRQVSLAATLGLGLIVAGFKIKTKDKEYLSYLPAAGIVILFVTILGGSLYHNLYDPRIALLMIGSTAAATIAIYDELRLFAYLMISKIGAYLAPFAFISTASTELIQVYFLIISTAFTAIAVMLNLRPIAVLAAYFALFATSAFGFHDKLHLEEASLYLLCQGLIFLSGTLYHTFTTKRAMKAEESLLYFPLILFFYGLEYAFVSQLYPVEAPFISIAFAAFLLGVYAVLKAKLPKGTALPSEDVLMSSAFSVLAHSLYFVLLPSSYQPMFFMVLLLLAAYLYNQVHTPASWQLFRKLLTFVGAGLMLWNYALVLFSLIFRDETVWVTSGFLMSGGLITLMKTTPWFRREEQQMPWLLYAPHLLVASSLYALLKNTGSFAVSASWAVYALAILAYGASKKDKTIAQSSMVILILSSLKVFFYDLSGNNTSARVLSLLVTGVLLYTAGWVFRKI